LILHICNSDPKFIKPFYDFTQAHFLNVGSTHWFYINGTGDQSKLPIGNNVFLAQRVNRIARYAWLNRNLKEAEKIILHGLWDDRALALLSLQPWLLKKCYWVIWGGDLYTHILGKKTLRWWRFEMLRRFAIERIGHFVTQIRGDYELAQQWYGANGVWHECFMYPSNLHYAVPQSRKDHNGMNILVGNSADPSNNHIDVLQKLQQFMGAGIQIFCPLSYGDQKHAQKVVEYGVGVFGERFIALREFIEFDKYAELLSKIDIAVFNHERQQGLGNMTTLLGLGKKVFLRSDTTSWAFYRKLGLKVFNVDELNIDSLSVEESNANREIIARYFSRDSLITQLTELFR
jgi:dTDP-N-acetylfucosamine:lipid II N-acetylfucosaminyltransferase